MIAVDRSARRHGENALHSISNYSLMTEGEAGNWLALTLHELRQLRREGGGPRYVTLPNGQVKYTLKSLDAWAFSRERNSVIHDYWAGAKIIPLPGSGVRVRKRLPPNWTPKPKRATQACRRRPRRHDDIA